MIRNKIMPMIADKSNGPRPLGLGEGDPADTGTERVIESRDLLDGRDQVVIRHEGRIYRLHRTRLGKLILTA
jgi:hemin uptake protein HemP